MKTNSLSYVPQARHSGWKAATAWLLFAPGLTFCQTVSNTANPSPKPAEEQPIELTPFEVRADRDTGYIGLDAASGSRLNSKVRDTPAAISIFTAEFMQDIAATSVEDLSKWSPRPPDSISGGRALIWGPTISRPG